MMKRSVGAMAVLLVTGAWADWTFDPGAMTLTDGVWTMNVRSVDGTELTLSTIKEAGPTDSAIDFTQPVADGYSIVSIYGSDSKAFKYKDASYAAEIRLPATLKRVENYAFQGCKIPITLPEENALVSVGDASFQLSAFAGTLVLNDGCTLGSNAFGSSAVKTLVVKHKHKTGLPPTGALPELTKLVLAGEGFTFAAKGLNGIYAKLTDFDFTDYPTFAKNWGTGVLVNNKLRFYIPTANEKWETKIAGSGFTPWTECDQTAYTDLYGTAGEMPFGRLTSIENSGSNGIWIFYKSSGAKTGATLVIDGEAENLGAPEPAYGTVEGVTEKTTCTAPQTVAAGEVLWACAGWTFAVWNDAEKVWVASQTGETSSFVYEPTEGEMAKLVWAWTPVAYKVTAETTLAGTAVTEVSTPDREGFYSPGTTASFTAEGEDFVRWVGVPAGVEATQRTISFTVTEPVQVKPYFRHAWTYDATVKTLTDGFWSFTAAANGKELTIKSVKTASTLPLIDWNKPIDDDYTIVRIEGGERVYDGVAEIVLPATLREVGSWAFQRATGTITAPEGLVLTSVGESAFWLSGLAGTVCLGEEVAELATGTFQSCQVNEWRFQGCPAFGTNWAAGALNGTGVRAFVPVEDVGWQAYLKAATFTPWAQCTAANRAAYYETFGADAQRPRGYTTAPLKMWLLSDKVEGLTILVR